MSLTSRKARPVLFAGALAFVAGVWPTLYSPLGEDRMGNPMRENRFTGAEEIKPAGTSEWIDAAKYLEVARVSRESDAPLLVASQP